MIASSEKRKLLAEQALITKKALLAEQEKIKQAIAEEAVMAKIESGEIEITKDYSLNRQAVLVRPSSSLPFIVYFSGRSIKAIQVVKRSQIKEVRDNVQKIQELIKRKIMQQKALGRAVTEAALTKGNGILVHASYYNEEAINQEYDGFTEKTILKANLEWAAKLISLQPADNNLGYNLNTTSIARNNLKTVYNSLHKSSEPSNKPNGEAPAL